MRDFVRPYPMSLLINAR